MPKTIAVSDETWKKLKVRALEKPQSLGSLLDELSAAPASAPGPLPAPLPAPGVPRPPITLPEDANTTTILNALVHDLKAYHRLEHEADMPAVQIKAFQKDMQDALRRARVPIGGRPAHRLIRGPDVERAGDAGGA